ncbi:MAG: SdrD B-like domain-containing protein [Candidatus Omnitrophota bacterium]
MKRKIGLILFFILFSSPLFLAFGDDFIDPAQREYREEMSPESWTSYPAASYSNEDIDEATLLIEQLEREIALTNKMLDLREEVKPEKKPFRTSKEEIIYLFEEFKKEYDLTNEMLYPGGREEEKEEEEMAITPTEEKAEPEIVVAKQISEEPAKTLPREDHKSSIPPSSPPPRPVETKRPKEEKVSQKTTTYRYSISELEKNNYSITIEKEQIAVIPVPGMLRFLVTNPEVIEASRQSDAELAVKAIGLGESFVHIWDEGGRKTLRVKVVQKGHDIFRETQLRLIEAEKMESFKVRYSYDRYRLNSKSDNPDRSYHYTDWYQRLDISGETPWGMAAAKFQYEGKGYREDDFHKDLSAWHASLTGPDIEGAFGDVGAYFSEITLPATAYQGFRFKNPDRKNITFDTMWGARGAAMWGKKVVDFQGKNYFYGGKFGVKPTDFLSLRTTVMRSQGNDLETSEVVAGGGMGLTFFDGAINLDGEYARGQHGGAVRGELNLKSDEYKFNFNGIARSIDSDYELVFDQSVPYRGEKGYYLKLSYYPLKFLKYSAEYNRFRNKYLPSTTTPYKHNYDFVSTLGVDLTDMTRFSWTLWNRGRMGMNPMTKDYGNSFNLQHSFSFFKNSTTVFANYFPATYKNRDSASSSYDERRLIIGMRMNVFKNLYFDISELWHYRQMLENRDSGTSSSMNLGVAYSSRIFNTPFYGSVAWRYKKDSNIMSGISVLANEEYGEIEGEIKYKPGPDMELYLRINNKDIKPIIDSTPTNKRREMRMYWGGTYLLDTTLRFSNAGGVQGYVFKDLNNNGIKDAEDEGMPKVDIFAQNKKCATTNERGFYKFDKLQGEEASILLDIKTLPEGYSSTVSNPQAVRLEREKISEVNFGVLARTEVSGQVFNDVNMNGEMDGDDYGIRDILIALDDGTTDYTEAAGYYNFEYIKSGERTLSLNMGSLPANLLPLCSSKKTFIAKEGDDYKENFPLYALRTIIGTVFVDKNGNGKFDADEEGVADIELKVEDNSTLTDGMGRYFLKKLKGGAQKVEIVIESIPKEYELRGDASRDVELAKEGDIKEDVDFPLVKR